METLTADIHGIVQERRRCRDGSRGGKAEKAGGDDFVQHDHVSINVLLEAIVFISMAGAGIFVLSVKRMSHEIPNWLAAFGGQ